MIQDTNSGVRGITPLEPILIPTPSKQPTTERAMDIEAKMRERKLQASLLSIKMFWAPELEKERRSRISERKRADKAETVLKTQLEKGLQYMQKLMEMEGVYRKLEEDAGTKIRNETELRTQLEIQLKRQTQARLQKYSHSDTVQMEEKLHRQTYEIQKMQTELNEASHTRAGLRSRLEIANKKLDEADVVASKVAALESDLRASKQVIKENEQLKIRQMQLEQTSSKALALKAKQEQLQQMVDTMKEELAKSAEMNLTAQQHIQSMAAEQGSFKKEKARLEGQKKTLTTEKSDLERKLNEVQLEAVGFEQAKFTASIETERLNNKFSGMQLDLKTKTEQITSMKRSATNSDKMIEVLRTSVGSTEKRSEQISKQLQAKAMQLESTRAELVLEKETHQKAIASVRENEDAQSKVDDLMNKIALFEVKLGDKESELGRFRADLERKSQETMVSSETSAADVDRIKTLETRLLDLEAEIATKTAELRQSQAQAQDVSVKVKEETKELETRIATAQALSVKHKAKTTSLTRKNLALQADIGALKKQTRENETTHAEVEKKLEAASSQLELVQNQIQSETASREQMTTQQQQRLDALVSETDQVRDELKQQTKKNLALAQKCSSAEAKVSDTEGRNASLTMEAEQSSMELDNLKAKVTEVETLTSEQEEKISNIATELMAKKARVSDLQRTIRDVEERHITDITNNIMTLIADLDKQIARLEEEGAQKNKQWIEDLLSKRKEHVDELKVQFDRRSALLESAVENIGGEGQRSELVETLEVRRTESKGMKSYIDQLLDQVRSEDDVTVEKIMSEMPELAVLDETNPDDLSDEALAERISTEADMLISLETYVDQLLNEILNHCPTLLETGALQISSP